MFEIISVLLLVAIALIGSLRWVRRDAVRRGHDSRDAAIIALLCWPAGLSLWIMVRSHHQLAPEGMGNAWG